MTKAELIASVSAKAEISKQDAGKAVVAVLDTVMESLAQGQKVQIVGFGTFEVRERSARVGRNPQDPTKTVEIPAKTVPVFKAGKLLRDAVSLPAKKTAKKAAAKTAKK